MKTLRYRLVLLSILVAACPGLLGLNRDQQPTPGASHSTAAAVGGAVGTGISAALSAAFPAAATIITAIWGAHTTDKKTAAQVQPPLTEIQKTTATQIQQLSANLDTVNIFLAHCVVADRSVVQMRDVLKNPTITEDDKKRLTSLWNEVQPRLTELGSANAKSSANAVTDEYTKRSLLAISETNYGDLTNIKNDIDQKEVADLRDRINSLEPKLSAVAALSADIIGQVSAGLHAGAKNLAPSQGPEDEKEKAFKNRIAQSRTAYQTIMKDVFNVSPSAEQ